MYPRGRLSRPLAVVLVMLGLGVATTACASPSVTAPTEPAPTRLVRLVELAVQRLGTADTVAAAKWVNGGPIVDLDRERAVIDTAAAGATPRGLDPGETAQFFQDQIEASKAVQYGLFSDWTVDPAGGPATAPDLVQVRPVLDRMTGDMLDALAASNDLRAGSDCRVQLDRAIHLVERDQVIDPLHRGALGRALSSVCR